MKPWRPQRPERGKKRAPTHPPTHAPTHHPLTHHPRTHPPIHHPPLPKQIQKQHTKNPKTPQQNKKSQNLNSHFGVEPGFCCRRSSTKKLQIGQKVWDAAHSKWRDPWTQGSQVSPGRRRERRISAIFERNATDFVIHKFKFEART